MCVWAAKVLKWTFPIEFLLSPCTTFVAFVKAFASKMNRNICVFFSHFTYISTIYSIYWFVSPSCPPVETEIQRHNACSGGHAGEWVYILLTLETMPKMKLDVHDDLKMLALIKSSNFLLFHYFRFFPSLLRTVNRMNLSEFSRLSIFSFVDISIDVRLAGAYDVLGVQTLCMGART